MASPCVDESETVTLEVDGTPGVLTAKAHDVSNTWSGTQGDELIHEVNDTGIPHVQTQTINVPNPLSENAVQGIVIASFAPIQIVYNADDAQFVVLNELLIGGVLQDSSETLPIFLTEDDAPGDVFSQISMRTLLGQINIAASGFTAVTFRKTITQGGAGQAWAFCMHGDKMVTVYGP
jgi:hypothetical protein